MVRLLSHDECPRGDRGWGKGPKERAPSRQVSKQANSFWCAWRTIAGSRILGTNGCEAPPRTDAARPSGRSQNSSRGRVAATKGRWRPPFCARAVHANETTRRRRKRMRREGGTREDEEEREEERRLIRGQHCIAAPARISQRRSGGSCSAHPRECRSTCCTPWSGSAWRRPLRYPPSSRRCATRRSS